MNEQLKFRIVWTIRGMSSNLNTENNATIPCFIPIRRYRAESFSIEFKGE